MAVPKFAWGVKLAPLTFCHEEPLVEFQMSPITDGGELPAAPPKTHIALLKTTKPKPCLLPKAGLLVTRFQDMPSVELYTDAFAFKPPPIMAHNWLL